MSVPVTAPVPCPDAPPPGTVLPSHNEGCHACGTDPHGLGMRLTVADDATLTCDFAVDHRFAGASGLAHGGVLAAVFDEMQGALQVFVGEPAVTASLTTQYRRPVPTGTVLHLRSRLDRRDGRKLHTSAVAHLGGHTGPVAAESSGLFVVVAPEHFARGGAPASWRG